MGLRAPPWQGAAQPACASAPASGLGGFFWLALLSPGGEGIVETSCAWDGRPSKMATAVVVVMAAVVLLDDESSSRRLQVQIQIQMQIQMHVQIQL